MDDLLTGSDTIKNLLRIQQEISRILLTGGFELRKWSTNSPEAIKKFKLIEHLNSNTIELGENETNKTLGILWNPKQDCIQFSANILNDNQRVTKRNILSKTAQIFDPLGLLSPIIIVAKLIMKNIWRSQVTWDEPVPNEIYISWSKFCSSLSELAHLFIPRYISTNIRNGIELIGFSDASERAYGACLYIRSVSQAGKITVNLLCSKSRVAPTKQVSLPRLELCGTQLLANLSNFVQESMNFQFTEKYYFSDSTIALCWIRSSPSRWKTFVANRVGEIQSLTKINEWNHVKSADNPADLISRGITTRDLLESSLWWHGPDWLSKEKSTWSQQNLDIPSIPVIEEKPIVSLKTTETKHHFELFNRFSSFNKLQRVTALCLRFCNNLKSEAQNRSLDFLTVDELSNALKILVKLAQVEFKQDLADLKAKGYIRKSSRLSSLTPFLDENKIIRVGGRINNANYNFDKTHPILLPEKHPLTMLLLTSEHLKLFHCGPQMLLASIREKFWPLSGRNAAKQVVRNCIVCFKCQPVPTNQIMGSLPKDRITRAPPFFNTGVDYAGPFMIKDRPNRSFKLQKSYICLFICFVTKAIHLELVTDLTTEAFLASLRRFIARRGKPKNMFSDNGTNFVGANTELKKLYQIANSNCCQSELIKDEITWHFIPPRAPNFGGLWESNVKCIKHHLKRIVGTALLTFDEFNTVLVQVEAILNSRPLTPMSEDPNDLSILTPSHFLIGRKLTSAPDPSVVDIKMNRLSRYQHLQAIQQHFWNRWSKEYLCELQRRYKWHVSTEQLKPGAMVIVREDNLPTLKWLLGRVIAVHPGPDGLSRVATVKTANSVMKRAISKLCFLPFEQ